MFEVADSEIEIVDVMDCENRSRNDYHDDFRKNRGRGCHFQSPEKIVDIIDVVKVTTIFAEIAKIEGVAIVPNLPNVNY